MNSVFHLSINLQMLWVALTTATRLPIVAVRVLSALWSMITCDICRVFVNLAPCTRVHTHLFIYLLTILVVFVASTPSGTWMITEWPLSRPNCRATRSQPGRPTTNQRSPRTIRCQRRPITIKDRVTWPMTTPRREPKACRQRVLAAVLVRAASTRIRPRLPTAVCFR